jgi:hypothetical protein
MYPGPGFPKTSKVKSPGFKIDERLLRKKIFFGENKKKKIEINPKTGTIIKIFLFIFSLWKT